MPKRPKHRRSPKGAVPEEMPRALRRFLKRPGVRFAAAAIFLPHSVKQARETFSDEVAAAQTIAREVKMARSLPRPLDTGARMPIYGVTSNSVVTVVTSVPLGPTGPQGPSLSAGSGNAQTGWAPT